MASKQVLDRQKLTSLVVAAGQSHGALIAQRLGDTLLPYVKRGETLPDLKLVSDLCLRWLSDAESTLVAADLAHERELADDSEPRRRRDEHAAALREQLIDLRDLVSALYGTDATLALGMSGETPTDAVALSRQGKNVLLALASVRLPKPRRRGAELSPKEIEAELKPAVAALDQALADVARESREAQATLAARDTAWAEFERRYSATTAVLAALLAAAGETALSEKLRPSAGRKPQPQPEPEPTPAPT